MVADRDLGVSLIIKAYTYQHPLGDSVFYCAALFPEAQKGPHWHVWHVGYTALQPWWPT